FPLPLDQAEADKAGNLGEEGEWQETHTDGAPVRPSNAALSTAWRRWATPCRCSLLAPSRRRFSPQALRESVLRVRHPTSTTSPTSPTSPTPPAAPATPAALPG